MDATIPSAIIAESRRQTLRTLAAAAQRLERRLDADLETAAGVSYAEFRLLDSLGQSGSCDLHLNEVAAILDLSPSGLTRMLDRLEAAGFVERRAGADRRGLHAALTDLGRDRLAAALEAEDAALACLMVRISLDGLRSVSVLLGDLAGSDPGAAGSEPGGGAPEGGRRRIGT